MEIGEILPIYYLRIFISSVLYSKFVCCRCVNSFYFLIRTNNKTNCVNFKLIWTRQNNIICFSWILNRKQSYNALLKVGTALCITIYFLYQFYSVEVCKHNKIIEIQWRQISELSIEGKLRRRKNCLLKWRKHVYNMKK